MAAAPARPEDSEAARLIARTAARLFARKGFEATSTREIVEESGVTKPTLYYHFGSKEGLARAIVLDPLTALAERLERIVREETDPFESLVGIVEAHFDFCREAPDRSRLFFAAAFGPPESDVARLMECDKGNLKGWTEAAFGRCVEAGMVDPGDVEAFSAMFRGMLVISIIDFLYDDKPLGEGRARVLVAALLRAFEGRRGAGPDGRT